ncbi:MAG: glycosyltransferase family 2 protein [Bacteroidota bacterium]|nr:glycosyltransferase family 2 protein [Bacteroidota bacterium]
MLVSIIIVNYNTGKILKECVDSVYNFEKKTDIEIIIVDNFSTDDSKSIIENLSKQHTEIKPVFLNFKTSFSTANNQGFELSKGEFILIMNPDIIFTGTILKKLASDLISVNNLGAVSPLLQGIDGKFQGRYFQRYPTLLQFIFFYSFFTKLFQGFPVLVEKYLHISDLNFKLGNVEFIDQIPCAFFFTKRNIFEEVDKMDDRYELFFEDVDLSYQISKKYKLAIDTSLEIKHLGGESFKTSDDFWLHGRFIMSMITFFGKNYSSVKTFILKLLAVSNSYFILLLESCKKLFGKEDDYRIRKHTYFIKEFKKFIDRS